ncbi:hypothetical protein [Mycolicibacterium mengxianglii]|uniref:hypothetical protein n=1 Tax=Mycolicibacterium mengxianglii TaxID=2736649 RepID=UPI0018D0DD82|nr:hypothetical protein [Mycolicibacterium mengxianglii]
MSRRRTLVFVCASLVAYLAACSTVIPGTPTWPGATLEKVVLNAGDFPTGVRYERITFAPGRPDGAGGPPAMLSKPPGCTDALTNVIAKSAERGPGSAVQYSATYDGARVVMTVLSWQLDLDALAQTADRCQEFNTYFDPVSPGIPMTTTKLPSEDGTLVYQQTMHLNGDQNSMYMAFANVGSMAMFGLTLPMTNPEISVKAALPQTFLDVVAKQADRIAAA